MCVVHLVFYVKSFNGLNILNTHFEKWLLLGFVLIKQRVCASKTGVWDGKEDSIIKKVDSYYLYGKKYSNPNKN